MLIQTYMQKNVDLFTDNKTGEVNESAMAEDACEEFGILLDEDGNAPENIYFMALKIAQIQEIKTGAREPFIRRDISEYINRLDANFDGKTG